MPIAEVKSDDVETRIADDSVEVRSIGNKEILLGRIMYNSLSVDMGGFRERFLPGAFAEHLRSNPDVFAKYEHGLKGSGLPLGRTSAGTLRLKDGPEALEFEIDPPDTTEGRDLLVSAKRRDTKGSSFGFRVPKGGEKWVYENGQRIREISKAVLTDISPTPYPVYPGNDVRVAMRSLEAWQAETEGEERRSIAYDLSPGDFVTWMAEDPDELAACAAYGKVAQIWMEGEASIPGTSITLKATTKDPAALIMGHDYDEDDELSAQEEFFLVPFSRLNKIVIEAPAEDAPMGLRSIEGTLSVEQARLRLAEKEAM